MNIPRPEHLESQYIYREFGGYIFKLPRNKDLCYQSSETQEYYYWTLTEIAYKHLVADKSSNPRITTTQVAGWQFLIDPSAAAITTDISTTNTQHGSRYIQLNELKKTQRDKLIALAVSKVQAPVVSSTTNNVFQYIETVS